MPTAELLRVCNLWQFRHYLLLFFLLFYLSRLFFSCLLAINLANKVYCIGTSRLPCGHVTPLRLRIPRFAAVRVQECMTGRTRSRVGRIERALQARAGSYQSSVAPLRRRHGHRRAGRLQRRATNVEKIRRRSSCFMPVNRRRNPTRTKKFVTDLRTCLYTLHHLLRGPPTANDL